MPRPVACGHSLSAASSSAPDPVPRSRMRRGPEMAERGLDHGFAVGPGDQHIRAHLETQRPEVARAGDVRDRLMREAAGEKRVRLHRHGEVAQAEQHLAPLQPGGMRCDQLGIEPGRVADGRKPGRRVAEPMGEHVLCRHSRAGGNPFPDRTAGCKAVRWIPAYAGMTEIWEGRDHPTSSSWARRAASSSAMSAAMTSSRPGPSRISGRRCRVRLMRWSVTRPCGKL
jgi:hypothetical protein